MKRSALIYFCLTVLLFGAARMLFQSIDWIRPFSATLISTAALFLSIHLYQHPGDKGKVYGVGLALCVAFAYKLVSPLLSNLINPKDWDFLGYYLFGVTAVEGLNFYDPTNIGAVFETLSIPFAPGKDFMNIVVDTGFVYPPPSMFLFAPFGYFSFQTANILCVALILSTILLQRQFFPKNRFGGWLIVATILTLSQPSITTFYYQQTNFLLLLTLIFAWKWREKAVVGLCIAIGMFIKPFVGVMILYVILQRNVPGFITFILSTAVMFTLSLVIFGLDVVESYFSFDFIGRIHYDYFLTVNYQSLLSTLLRSGLINSTGSVPVFHPLYLGLVSFFVLGTCWISYLKPDKCFCLVLLLALIIYPQTLCSYGVVLVIPLLFLSRTSWMLTVAGFCLLFYSTFLASLVLWSCFGVLVTRSRMEFSIAMNRQTMRNQSG